MIIHAALVLCWLHFFNHEFIFISGDFKEPISGLHVSSTSLTIWEIVIHGVGSWCATISVRVIDIHISRAARFHQILVLLAWSLPSLLLLLLWSHLDEHVLCYGLESVVLYWLLLLLRHWWLLLSILLSHWLVSLKSLWLGLSGLLLRRLAFFETLMFLVWWFILCFNYKAWDHLINRLIWDRTVQLSSSITLDWHLRLQLNLVGWSRNLELLTLKILILTHIGADDIYVVCLRIGIVPTWFIKVLSIEELAIKLWYLLRTVSLYALLGSLFILIILLRHISESSLTIRIISQVTVFVSVVTLHHGLEIRHDNLIASQLLTDTIRMEVFILELSTWIAGIVSIKHRLTLIICGAATSTLSHCSRGSFVITAAVKCPLLITRQPQQLLLHLELQLLAFDWVHCLYVLCHSDCVRRSSVTWAVSILNHPCVIIAEVYLFMCRLRVRLNTERCCYLEIVHFVGKWWLNCISFNVAIVVLVNSIIVNGPQEWILYWSSWFHCTCIEFLTFEQFLIKFAPPLFLIDCPYCFVELCSWSGSFSWFSWSWWLLGYAWNVRWPLWTLGIITDIFSLAITIFHHLINLCIL